MVNPDRTEPISVAAVSSEAAPIQLDPTGASIRSLVLARWGARALVLAALAMFIASVPLRHAQLASLTFPTYSRADILRASDPATVGAALSSLGISAGFYAGYTIAFEILFAAVFGGIAVMISRDKVHPWLSLLVSLTLILFGLSGVPTMEALVRANAGFQLPVRFVNTLSWTLLGVFYYLFPDGRFVPRWIWPLSVIWAVWQTSWSIFPDVPWNPLLWLPEVALAVWLVWFVTGVAAQVYRYMRVSTPVQCQQTKWVVFGLTVAVAGAIVVNAVGVMSILQPGSGAAALYELVKVPLTYVFVLMVPIFIGISILRYRLWEIDLLINRTLVYIPLTAIVAGLYTTSITFSQRLFVAITGEKSDAAIVFTTLVVASTFTPLKNSLQAIVDKRFKEMPDRTKRLHAFGAQVQSVVQVIDVRQITRRVLDEAVTAFDAQCAAVRLVGGQEEDLVHTHGEWEACQAVVTVPIESDGITMGVLSLGPREDGSDYTERDREALEVAVAPVARAILLTRRAA